MRYILTESQVNFLIETREGFMNYLRRKSQEVTGIVWPDYVLRDWLYRNTKDIKDESPEEYKDLVRSYLISFVEGHGPGHWENKTLELSMDSFTKFVQQDLKKKIEGFRRSDIAKDVERHELQQNKLDQGEISTEPIIVVQTKDGKYDLLEGWHSTTAALKKFGNYKQNAWVYVLD